jgi:hypothetical protein
MAWPGRTRQRKAIYWTRQSKAGMDRIEPLGRDITIEMDTIEYQQTEKIETEVSDDDRIRAHRCTQHHPGCPSGVSPSHNIIYYSTPADRSPSKKETPR